MMLHLIQVIIIGGLCWIAGFVSCMVVVICAAEQGKEKYER